MNYKKKPWNLLKDFFINNELVTKNEYDKNMKELADKLKELKEKSEKNNLFLGTLLGAQTYKLY